MCSLLQVEVTEERVTLKTRNVARLSISPSPNRNIAWKRLTITVLTSLWSFSPYLFGRSVSTYLHYKSIKTSIESSLNNHNLEVDGVLQTNHIIAKTSKTMLHLFLLKNLVIQFNSKTLFKDGDPVSLQLIFPRTKITQVHRTNTGKHILHFHTKTYP
mgnify:CR=1 FL=1